MCKKPEIITIVGKSNSGKTTLAEKLIANMTGRGYKIGSVKHTHCGFDLDQKGKDSWRHKKAGAKTTLVITDEQVAMVKDDKRESVEKMQSFLFDMDLILAEGFKGLDLPKIEVFRAQAGHKEPIFLNDENLVALVTDLNINSKSPVFGLEDISLVSDLIETLFLKK